MVVREVSLLSPQAKPEKPLGFFNVSLCIRSFVPRFNVAKLQRKEGPLVFVSGAVAITPKYLVI